MTLETTHARFNHMLGLQGMHQGRVRSILPWNNTHGIFVLESRYLRSNRAGAGYYDVGVRSTSENRIFVTISAFESEH